jgi:hypothetical protein
MITLYSQLCATLPLCTLLIGGGMWIDKAAIPLVQSATAAANSSAVHQCVAYNVSFIQNTAARAGAVSCSSTLMLAQVSSM